MKRNKPYLTSLKSLKKALVLLVLMMISSFAFSQVLPTVTTPPSAKNASDKKKAAAGTKNHVNKKKPKMRDVDPNIPDESVAPDTTDDFAKAALIDTSIKPREFSEKARGKTKELTDYIGIIIENTTPRDQAYKSIDQACLLFANEKENRVEVSSLNTKEKNRYYIREYLNRLQQRSGRYDKIKIEYANVSYATHFKKGTDGNWHGSVTFEQTFTGYVDGKAIYSDITKKNVEIIAKKYDKDTENGIVASWDVFLGDIGVAETRRNR